MRIGILGICVILTAWGWHKYLLEEEKTLEIIYIPKTMDQTNEFWTSLIAGTQMAAQEEKINLTVTAPETEDDYERQNELILWAIEQKPDAIVLSPCDYTQNLEAAKQIKANGIPLVFVDSEVSENIGDCIVSTDNFIAGIKMGELAEPYIDDTTKIAIVSHVKNSSTAMERIRGFEYAIGDAASGIVDIVYCDSNYEKAYELTCLLLEKYPDLDMIVGTNEYAALGAAQAVKQLGYKDCIFMVGFDNSIEEVRLLEEQVFNGIVIQKSFHMGYLGIAQAASLARGETCPKKIDSGSVLITQENMNEEENQKLLFPFIGKQFRENVYHEIKTSRYHEITEEP